MNFKKQLLLLSSVLLLIVSVGCSKKASVDGILTVAIPASPATLDPRMATDAYGDKIANQLIFDGLFARNEKMEIVPSLAKSYDLISPTEFRFELREGVKFHNGEELTSDDVIYTYSSIINGDVLSPFKAVFDRVESMTPDGKYALNIRLKEPYAPFLTLLTRGIVPKAKAVELGESFGAHPVGTGAFILESFTPEQDVVLKKNPNYFGGTPDLTGLKFVVVKDDNIRILKLMKGDIDLVLNAVPPLLLDKVREDKNLKVKEGIGIVAGYLGMNLTDDILKNVSVRKAIAHAIDRDEIIKHRWQGLAVKANSIISPDNWSYPSGLKELKYDPKLAKELLDEAGFKDPDGDGDKPRFKLTFKTSTSKERIDIARMIAHQLAKVGIEIEVLPYEWGTFYRDVKNGNFQLYSLSWVGLTEPDIFFDVCHSSRFPPDGVNRGRYSNITVDKLVEQGRVTMDQNERKKIYAKVQKILLEDLPYIPLWYEKNVAVSKKGVMDFALWPNASFKPLVKTYVKR
ncbi:MAG: ABC transporter substrate-binding protein [Pseudomonadota bacterium]